MQARLLGFFATNCYFVSVGNYYRGHMPLYTPLDPPLRALIVHLGPEFPYVALTMVVIL